MFLEKCVCSVLVVAVQQHGQGLPEKIEAQNFGAMNYKYHFPCTKKMMENTTSQEEKNNFSSLETSSTPIIMMGQSASRDETEREPLPESIDIHQIRDGDFHENRVCQQEDERHTSHHTTTSKLGMHERKENSELVDLKPLQVKNDFFQGANKTPRSKLSEPYQPTPRELKSLEKLSVLPQWRVDLQKKNREEIEFRNSLKEKYKTEMYGSCDGYLKKLQEINEAKKSISKSYTASKKPAYVPEGKYVPPSKPKKTIEEDKLVFKKRFEYSEKVAKAILEENLKKSARIKEAKLKEMERMKEEERKKKEMEMERKKKETEERRKQLAQLKEKKPPLSGEELYKARMEKLRQENLKILAKKKGNIQYPVMKKLASKKKLDTTNPSDQKERGEEKKTPREPSETNEITPVNDEMVTKKTLTNNPSVSEDNEQRSLSEHEQNDDEENEIEYESQEEEETEVTNDKEQQVENDVEKPTNVSHSSIPSQENQFQNIDSDVVKENKILNDDHNMPFNLSDDEESDKDLDNHSHHSEEENEGHSPNLLKEPEQKNNSSDLELDENELIAKKIISEIINRYETIQGHIQECFASYANDIFDKGLLSSDEFSSVFSCLGSVRSSNANMLADLKAASDSSDSHNEIWDASNIEAMKDVFVKYVRSLPLAVETCLTTLQQNPKFHALVTSKSNDLVSIVDTDHCLNGDEFMFVVFLFASTIRNVKPNY